MQPRLRIRGGGGGEGAQDSGGEHAGQQGRRRGTHGGEGHRQLPIGNEVLKGIDHPSGADSTRTDPKRRLPPPINAG
ncbi:hypothetical protein GCM10020366_30690 [Saccharopolyspora gregorii]|uniref:Uncharacterized protein n=1 Tax=Saccharopolyspora gregorii TaxID=33914 RepID=A0ABP6RRB4_9PSEU